MLGGFVVAENISLLEDGEATSGGHTVQNVGGVILRGVLADDAIDQRAGAGTEQIDFDERILFLKHVHELFAFWDGDCRVPSDTAFFFRLRAEVSVDLSHRRTKTKL